MSRSGYTRTIRVSDRVGRVRSRSRECRCRRRHGRRECRRALDLLFRGPGRGEHRAALPDSPGRRRAPAAHDGRVLLHRSGRLAQRQADRVRAPRRRHPHHEHRRNGSPPPDDERPRQLPRLVARRRAHRLHPAVQDRVEGQHDVLVRCRGAAAPSGAAVGPAVLDAGRSADPFRGRPPEGRLDDRTRPEVLRRADRRDLGLEQRRRSRRVAR